MVKSGYKVNFFLKLYKLKGKSIADILIRLKRIQYQKSISKSYRRDNDEKFYQDKFLLKYAKRDTLKGVVKDIDFGRPYLFLDKAKIINKILHIAPP